MKKEGTEEVKQRDERRKVEERYRAENGKVEGRGG